jgi:hypothetical protein
VSHPAQVIIVRRGRAQMFTDRWLGARVLDALAEGPGGCAGVVEHLTETGEAARDVEAGWLVDFDRKQLIVVGDPETKYVGEEPGDAIAGTREAWRALVLPMWSKFTVEWATGGEAFEAYLRRVSPDVRVTAADLDALTRRLNAALGPIEADDAEDDAPRTAARAGWGMTALAAAVGALALVVRLLTMPFRARLHDRAKRRANEARRALLCRALDLTERRGVAASFERGCVLLQVGWTRHAERDFDRCVAEIEDAHATERDGVKLASALYDRGVCRLRLRKRKLADADMARAAELGLRPRTSSFGTLRALFLVISGLVPDG